MDMLRSIGNIMKNSGCEVPTVSQTLNLAKTRGGISLRNQLSDTILALLLLLTDHLKREKKQQRVARINRKKQRFNTDNENKGTNKPQKPTRKTNLLFKTQVVKLKTTNPKSQQGKQICFSKLKL